MVFFGPPKMGQKWPILGVKKGVKNDDLRSFLRKKRFFQLFSKNEIFWKKLKKVSKNHFYVRNEHKGSILDPQNGSKIDPFWGSKIGHFLLFIDVFKENAFFQKNRKFSKNFHGFLKNERKNRNFQNFSFFDIFYTVKSIDKILKISKKTKNFRFFSKIFENFWKFQWKYQRKKLIFCRKNRFFGTTQL